VITIDDLGVFRLHSTPLGSGCCRTGDGESRRILSQTQQEQEFQAVTRTRLKVDRGPGRV